MADFLKAFKILMDSEGGYSNDSIDRGGETYRGISRKNHPKWQGWTIIDGMKLENNFPECLYLNETLNNMVNMFYKVEFWDKFKGDYIEDQNIGNELLDISVNMGISTSIRFLQRTLNLLNRDERDYHNIKEDGIFGNGTLDTLNSHPKNYKYIYNILNTLQGCYYINLSTRNETQERFLRGWLNRINFEDI